MCRATALARSTVVSVLDSGSGVTGVDLSEKGPEKLGPETEPERGRAREASFSLAVSCSTTYKTANFSNLKFKIIQNKKTKTLKAKRIK